MKSLNKYAIRTTAIAALIGSLGVAGASVAYADTVVDLDPKTDPSGAYCMVVDDRGDSIVMDSQFECTVVQLRIDADQRREEGKEERREDRRDERRDERQEVRSTN